MSEERFLAIERKLDAHTDLHADHTIKLDKIDGRLDGIDGRLDGVEGRLDRVEGRLDRVDGRLDRVEGRLDRIEVTVEQMRDDIKQIAEGHAATQAAIARSTQEVIAHIDKKVAPLEIAVRAHFGPG